ncbi:MAG: DUF885 domain-containing protein [Lewinella sp.]|nr:DUF885 domain-containing protein [Lewinella sp.]
MSKSALFWLSLLLLSTLSCTSEPAQDTTTDEDMNTFDQLLADYQEDRYTYFPWEATMAGDNRFNDQFPNILTQAYRDQVTAFFQQYKDQLQAVDRSSLSATQQMSYDILMWECNINLETMAFPAQFLPVNQFSAPHLVVGQLASGQSIQPFQTVEDYDNWLKRVDGFIAWCDTAMVYMRQGMEQGYTLPAALTLKTIPQMASFTVEPVEENLFYQPVNNMIADFPAEEKARISADYRTMVSEQIIPTFRRFESFMQDEYLPSSRASSGIDSVPGGADYYNTLIKMYTTTDLTADEIHELGLREVARLEAEMEKVKAQVGFEGSLLEFFDHVRERPELMPYDDPQQVIDHFNAIHERMKPQLARLFDLVPKTEFEVRRTEAFREASASAEYNQGSQDGSRPGIFYVPIPNVAEYNIFADEDLFLHEAIPGHHYQISLQQEDEKLPAFRRSLWYSAYGEGWALYCESLGSELGLYTDPYQYFGMLSAEMHRAIRLVVDTGIHAKGWTREQAIQYSLEHEAEPEASIIAEIERYMAIPGQALSYKIGQLKILELRARAEAAMGDDFDIRTFHRLVLEDGCLPLALLEKKIDNWIKQ